MKGSKVPLQTTYRRRQRVLGLIIEAVNIGTRLRRGSLWMLRTLEGENITDIQFRTLAEAMNWPRTFEGIDHIRSLMDAERTD